jgi:Family of unknown function (DUF6188)
MELIQESSGWRLAFRSGRVGLLKIDFRAALLLMDEPDTADLIIEVPFRLASLELHTDCFPEKASSLAPILPLVNRKIMEVGIKNSGHLTAVFESGLVLEVGPHPSYEAWQISGSTGFLLVCRPEAGVTFFNQKAVGYSH